MWEKFRMFKYKRNKAIIVLKIRHIQFKQMTYLEISKMMTALQKAQYLLKVQ